jgi:hypothetical protein
MPRLALRLWPPAALAACAALPPPLLHGALAATAGTLFEATPFVLAATLPRSGRLRALGSLVSCGCGSLPGALSLPAVALCWFAFGPLPALLRLGAGLVAALVERRRPHAGAAQADPLAELLGVGCAAFAGSVAAELLRATAGSWNPLASAVAGGLLGATLPCTAGAVALAAGMHGADPSLAWGILVTAGVLRLPRPWPPPAASTRPGSRPDAVSRPARFAYASLGAACLALALRDGAGFLNPRLVPFAAAGAVLSALCVLRNVACGARRATFVPAVLAVALALGSPQPRYEAGMTALADAFPGERLRFAGFVRQAGRRTDLVRFAISCCRADASPVGLPALERVPVRDGTWIEAAGTVVRTERGLALRIARWQRIRRPPDPFLYR